MRRERRQFSKEFKEQAVLLAESRDRPLSEIAANLDITDGLLWKWVAKSRKEGAEAFRGHGVRTREEADLHRLQAENARLRQELEFLKKVSRYFAKDPK